MVSDLRSRLTGSMSNPEKTLKREFNPDLPPGQLAVWMYAAERGMAAEHWDSCSWLCAVDWFVINDVTVSLLAGLEPDTQSGETFNL